MLSSPQRFEALEDVADVAREALDVGKQMLADVVGIADELAEVVRRDVVGILAGLREQERLWVHPGFARAFSSARTAAFDFASTQSRRRRTVNGR